MRRDMRLKHVARIAVSNVDKKSADDERPVRLCNYTDVYYNERITATIEFMPATASESQLRDFGLSPGDVVITKDSETPDDIAVPALVEESANDLVCGYHLAIIRPDRKLVDPRFLFWSLASTSARSWFSTQATGVTRFGLRAQSIGEARLSLPSLAEQRVIADFLDAETARIDALIEKTRDRVALLRERLAAKVSRATRITSLFEVSARRDALDAGWTFPLLRRCFRSMDYGIGDATEASGRYPVLGMGNVGDGQLIGDPVGYVSEVDATLLLKPFDLLFNRTNSLARVGKVGIFLGEPAKTTFASYLVRLRTSQLTEPAYMNYVLNTREFLGLARSCALPSVGQANLNPSRYGSLSIPLPSRDRQREIVAELDALRTAVEGIRTALECQISLLRERRQALITAAVTGQLDVAKAAA